MSIVDAVIAWHHRLDETDSAGCSLCRKRREDHQRLMEFIRLTNQPAESTDA